MILLVLFSMILYFNSLGGAFQFDDRNLIEKEWISSLYAFEKQVDLKAFENRPILLWTFAFNNSLHKHRVFGFHLLNLLLHIWVSILVFTVLVKARNLLTCSRTGGTPRPSRWEGKSSPHLPFLAALLFVVHPLNTDSVSYISSRSTLLATFFYLLTLFAFLGIFSIRGGRFQRMGRAGMVLFTVAGFYFALASKLIAVTLPLILALWYLAFIRPGGFPDFSSLFTRKKMIFLCGTVMAFLTAAFLILGPRILYSPKDQGLELFGRIPYLLVQIKVIVFYYLKLFFYPINLNVDNGYPFSTFFTDPQIALAFAVIAGIIFWVRGRGSLWVTMGAAWFFVTLAPTSSIVPLNDLAVEHRMYLPMTLGLCMAAAWAASRMRPPRRLPFVVALVALLACLTVVRNEDWIDEQRLWRDAVRKNPLSPRTHNNLGKAYYEQGKIDLALKHFEMSRENIREYARSRYNIWDPQAYTRRRESGRPGRAAPGNGEMQVVADFAEPHYNLAGVYLDQGRLKDAEKEYRIALKLNPNYFEAHLGLGSVYARLGKSGPAEDHFRLAIEKRRSAGGGEDYPLARVNLGQIYGQSGRYREAIAELQRAVRYDPSLVPAHYNLGLAYLLTGDLENAERSFETCLRLNDRFQPARFHLARVYQTMGHWERSTRQFEKWLALNGPDPAAYYQIGWNHQQAGEWNAARKYYERTLALKPDFLNARINLGKLFLQSRQFGLAREHLQKALDMNPPREQAEEISRLMRELS